MFASHLSNSHLATGAGASGKQKIAQPAAGVQVVSRGETSTTVQVCSFATCDLQCSHGGRSHGAVATGQARLGRFAGAMQVSAVMQSYCSIADVGRRGASPWPGE